MDAKEGNDVLDGGTVSHFLTGGAGVDIFVDGRGGERTWATITDFSAGEQATLWGYREGGSRLNWTDGEGAAGFEGRTLHVDLDGDGDMDASMTFMGLSTAMTDGLLLAAGLSSATPISACSGSREGGGGDGGATTVNRLVAALLENASRRGDCRALRRSMQGNPLASFVRFT